MPVPPEHDFEREKWLADLELRKRELAVKEREASRSRWSSPLVLAVLAAAIAALGNAAAIWLTGIAQRDLETTKAEQARSIEETKAEASRILEVIKTGDPDKAAVNLKFLVEAGLISDADRRTSLQKFLAARAAGQGPALPARPLTWEEIYHELGARGLVAAPRFSRQALEDLIRAKTPEEREQIIEHERERERERAAKGSPSRGQDPKRNDDPTAPRSPH
jgi:hypothetical protein